MRFFNNPKLDKDPIDLFVTKAEAAIEKLDGEIFKILKRIDLKDDTSFLASLKKYGKSEDKEDTQSLASPVKYGEYDDTRSLASFENEQTPRDQEPIHLIIEKHMRELVSLLDSFDKNTAKNVLLMWHKSSALLEIVDKVKEMNNPPKQTTTDLVTEYDLCLMSDSPNPESLDLPGKISIGQENGNLTYSLVDLEGNIQKNIKTNIRSPETFMLEKLEPLKNKILEVTSKAGHTRSVIENPVIENPGKKILDKADYEAIKNVIGEQKREITVEINREKRRFTIMDKRGFFPSDTAKMITELEKAIDAKIAALSNPSPPNP